MHKIIRQVFFKTNSVSFTMRISGHHHVAQFVLPVTRKTRFLRLFFTTASMLWKKVARIRFSIRDNYFLKYISTVSTSSKPIRIIKMRANTQNISLISKKSNTFLSSKQKLSTESMNWQERHLRQIRQRLSWAVSD